MPDIYGNISGSLRELAHSGPTNPSQITDVSQSQDFPIQQQPEQNILSSEENQTPESAFDAQKHWDKLKADSQIFLETFQLPDTILNQLSADDIQKLSDAAKRGFQKETFLNNILEHQITMKILEHTIGKGSQSTESIRKTLKTIEHTARAGLDNALSARTILGIPDDVPLTQELVRKQAGAFYKLMNSYPVQHGTDPQGVLVSNLVQRATTMLILELGRQEAKVQKLPNAA